MTPHAAISLEVPRLTKSRTKGEARRAKMGRPPVDGPREPNGRPSRSGAHHAKEAAVLAQVEARARAIGIWPAPIERDAGEPEDAWRARTNARLAMIRAAMQFVGLPWMGCNAGRAIRGERDVVDLWGVISMIRQRYAAHQRAIEAPPDPQNTLGRLVKPEPDQDAARREPPTPEDIEERTINAVDAWERLMISPDLVDIVVADCLPGHFPLARALRLLKARLDKAHAAPATLGVETIEAWRAKLMEGEE